MLPACSSGSTEVHPGDPDYPADNPHASALVEFTATVPSTLHPVFSTAYLASARACQRTIGGGVQTPLGFDAPLHLTQSQNTYRGTFAIDRFQPGNCEWRFVGMGYETRDPAAYGGPLLRYDERPGRPASVRLDIWCARAPRISPSHPRLCGSLKFLASFQGIVSPETLSAVPASVHADSDAQIGPDTRTVVVEFHDIDASHQ